MHIDIETCSRKPNSVELLLWNFRLSFAEYFCFSLFLWVVNIYALTEIKDNPSIGTLTLI